MAVIVTNAKNRIAYNIVRSLGQKGIQVHTADFVSTSMSFFSKYSKSHFLYPSPFKNQEKFIDCLKQNILRLNANVLIPVFEETFLIAKYKDELSKYVKMVIPDYNDILIAHNKDKWETVAEKLNIPIPRSFIIEELKNGKVKYKELKYPVLIKPKQGGGGWGIKQVDSSVDLKDLINQDLYNELEWNRFFVQEKIDGVTQCVAMLFRQGEYKAKVTYQQLRDFPINGGQATLRKSICNDNVEYYFEKLLKEIKWHGVCQADFIIEKKSNIPYLIDINPRFWGSLAQAIASDVDFPFLWYQIAKGKDVTPIKDFTPDVVTRWIGGDLRTFFPLLKNAKNKLKFIANYFYPGNDNIYYDDFDWKDPIPFFAWIIDSIFRIIKNKSLNPISHDSLEGIWK